MSASKRVQGLRAAATALLVTASVATGLAAAQPAQAAGCSLRYVANTWPVDANDRSTIYRNELGDWVSTGEPIVGIGMVLTFDLTNNGAAVNPWQGSWTTQGGLRMVGNIVWNATVTGRVVDSSASTVYLAGQPWNGSLPTGASASFGLQGILPGVWPADQIVTGFSLAGTACTVSPAF